MNSFVQDLSPLRTTVDGKKRIVQQFLSEGLSIRTFCAKYNIPPATLSRWKKQCTASSNGGAETLHARAGRPSKIDAEGQQEVISKLTQHMAENKNLRKRDLRAFCEEAAQLTAKRRKIGKDGVELSAKTIKKYVLQAAKSLMDESSQPEVPEFNFECPFAFPSSPSLSLTDSICSFDDPDLDMDFFLDCDLTDFDHIEW